MEENKALKLKPLSDKILQEVAGKIEEAGEQITLVSIIVGKDPSAVSYLRSMKKNANKIGMDVEIVEYDSDISAQDFFKEIQKYNNDQATAGVIIQMPLPKHLDFAAICETLDHTKDADGITPYNQGRLFAGNPFIIPATAQAVELSLRYIEDTYSFPLQGKNAVIVGRSNTVGKPAFHLLLRRNITPTVVHTRSVDVEKITSAADIVVATCGVPENVTDVWLKEGAVVIDVGIHYVSCSIEENQGGFKLCGDVHNESALTKASIVTAVPGGVGPVTTGIIFANAVKGWYKNHKNEEISFDFEK